MNYKQAGELELGEKCREAAWKEVEKEDAVTKEIRCEEVRTFQERPATQIAGLVFGFVAI